MRLSTCRLTAQCLFAVAVSIVYSFYFWWHWGFVAALRLSLVVVSGAAPSCGARASHCSGFSCCRTWALLSSWGSRALEHRFSSGGTQAWLLHGMWDLPGPGLELVFPALAGGFLPTVPPGKSRQEV